MKLISMTEFVLEQGGASFESDLFYFLCSNYAQFLKQPLTLGMFVPCVDNEIFNYSKHGNKEQYQQAKERVLFEGFELIGNELYVYNEFFIYTDDLYCWKIEDIEGLFPETTLTPTAIKQIGL